MKRIYLGLAACLLLPTASFAGLIYQSSQVSTSYRDLQLAAAVPAAAATYDVNGFLVYAGGNFNSKLTAAAVAGSSTVTCATCATTGAAVGGTFGSAGDTLSAGPGGVFLGFNVTDGPAGTNASTMNTSISAIFIVDELGFAGSIADFLSVSGVSLPGGNAAASLTGTVSISAGVAAQGLLYTFTPIVMGAQRNGVFSASDGSGLAASTFTLSSGANGTGAFSGSGLSWVNVGSLTPGTRLTFNSAITAFADPGSVINGTVAAAAPEPASFALIGAGLALVAFRFRRTATA